MFHLYAPFFCGAQGILFKNHKRYNVALFMIILDFSNMRGSEHDILFLQWQVSGLWSSKVFLKGNGSH